MNIKYSLLTLLIIVSISCNISNSRNEEPSLCLVRSTTDLYEILPTIDLQLLGLEYNPEAYFFISGTSMWGSRNVIISKCNGYTYKQFVHIPDEPGGAAVIAITGKSHIRYFTSKEISEISEWDDLSKYLHQFIGDNNPIYVDVFANDTYVIQYKYKGNEGYISFYDSIPKSILNFIDSIAGFEKNVVFCKDICDRYFESKAEK